MPFFLLFLIIPFVEVYGFIQVGAALGALPTVALCLLTGITGVFLVRKQGLETLHQAQRNMQGGQMPVAEIFAGFCIVVAGALLITPGFFTDIVGFLLLFPPFQQFLKKILLNKMDIQVKTSGFTGKSHKKDYIDGEFERVNDNNKSLK